MKAACTCSVTFSCFGTRYTIQYTHVWNCCAGWCGLWLEALRVGRPAGHDSVFWLLHWQEWCGQFAWFKSSSR